MSAALGLFRYAMHRADVAVSEALSGPLTITRRDANPHAGRGGADSGRAGAPPVAPALPGHQPSP